MYIADRRMLLSSTQPFSDPMSGVRIAKCQYRRVFVRNCIRPAADTFTPRTPGSKATEFPTARSQLPAGFSYTSSVVQSDE